MKIKMNFTNDQTAFEYALYMMASSYFNKSVCMSSMMERNMLLQYKEQNLNSQYFMEDLCISYLEQAVKKIPAEVFDQRVEAHFRRDRINNITEIEFMGYDYTLVFRCRYKGRKSEIEYAYGLTENYRYLAA